MIMQKRSGITALITVTILLLIACFSSAVSGSAGLPSANSSSYAIVCSSAPGGGLTQDFGISLVNLTTLELDTLFGGLSPAWGVAVSPGGDYLYLINEMGNKVTIMHAPDMAIKGTVDVGMYPQDAVVSPDGLRVYVSSAQAYYGDTISVISGPSGGVISTINTGISPGKMALSPDGGRLYVAQSFYGSHEATDEILVVDTLNNSLAGRLKAGKHPVSIAVSPDGSRVYVACMGTGIVTSIDVATGRTLGMAITGRAPVDIALSPDGSTLYAVNDYYGRSLVSTIHTANMSIIHKIDLPGHTVEEYRDSYIKRILVNGSTLYVSDYVSGSVYVINATSGAITYTVPAGNSPSGMALSHDRLYVASKGSGGLAVINTTSLKASPIGYAMSSRYVSILPDGKKAYITNGDIGTVTVLNMETRSIVATIDAGGIMNRLAVSPDGRTVYVADTGNGRIVLIDTATDRIAGNWSPGLTPVDVATSPDGGRVYVVHDRKATDASNDDLSMIEAATGKILSTSQLGKYAGRIAVAPDGKKLYICLWESGTILVVDASTGRTTSRITVRGSPEDAIVSADGKTVYVACPNGDGILAIDAGSERIIASIAASAHPRHIAITPDGTTLCASGRTGIVVIDLKNWSIIEEYTVGDTMGVAINPAAGGGWA